MTIDNDSIEEIFSRAEKVIEQQLESEDPKKVIEQVMYFVIANPFIAKLMIGNTADIVDHELKLNFLKDKFKEQESLIVLQTKALEKMDEKLQYLEMLITPKNPDMLN